METNKKKKVQEAIKLIESQAQELLNIIRSARHDQDFTAARERLRRWKSRTIKLISKHIHPNEGKKLGKKEKSSFIMGQPLRIRNLADEADMYRGFLLSLKEELEKHPEDVIVTCPATDALSFPIETPLLTASQTVFIIHGHDELNTLRLEKLLRERWNLEPILLSLEAGKGRTLIEKFEQEAQRASYAIALLTPDDIVEVSNNRYTQARPNVIFELGWFYGRLGRQRVCILFKKGTKIHSDLDGITRIEFNDSVNEKVTELEKELKEARLL